MTGGSLSEVDARLVILPSISSISLCQISLLTQGANCRGVGGGDLGESEWRAAQLGGLRALFAGLEKEKKLRKRNGS